ncbi:MAG: 2-C-methyl-D-erythritol 4-phosphate cytidylyltransferase [Deltaproteobacteria bacterium]|nr:2-C-methyl-D-erythritol 4-phosphate cytidylyltransferase [Deltaproteobacteria bacterium]
MSVKLSAVVVAAGRSQRFNQAREGDSSRLSKQLASWDGKPLFVHTLEALSVLPIIEWSLVIHPDEEDVIRENLNKFFSDLKIKIVNGGKRRQDSVRNGLEALEACDMVLIHDAARPFLSSDFLKNIFEKAKSVDALIPTMPIVETLKEIDSTGKVLRTQDRNRFVRVQTPQFFKFDLIMAAHEKLKNSSEDFTDDAAVMEACGYVVQTASGILENIKVTLPEDLRSRGIHV